MVKPASAQSTPIPNVPQITDIKITNKSYDIAPSSSTSTDPFTGQQTTSNSPSGQFTWSTLDMTVTNQKYDEKQINEYGYYNGYLYFVRFKGHFTTQWTEEPTILNYYFPHDSNGTYITLSFVLNNAFASIASNVPDNLVTPHSISLPQDGLVDFQVKALIGTLATNRLIFGDPEVFNGTMSDWSNILTITLTKGQITNLVSTPSSPTASTTPTATSPSALIPTETSNAPSPTVPELSCLVILPLLLSALFVAVAVRYRKVNHD